MSKYNKIAFSLNILIIIYLFAGKYYFNGLSLTEINFLYTGNVLFIIIYSFVILGQLFSLKSTDRKLEVLNLLLTLVASLLIFLSFISHYFNILFFVNKIFLIPSNKVLIFLMVISSSLVQIYLSFFIIYKKIDKRKFPIFKSLKGTAFVIIIPFIFSLLYIFSYEPVTKIENAKTAFVLGAAVWGKDKPSPLFKTRLDKALDLINSEKVKNIFLTGGKAPGELSESEVGRKYLQEKGIDESKIKLEKLTTSTLEQIKYLSNNFEKKQAEIVIISNRFHIPRVVQILKFFNLSTKTLSVENEYSGKRIINYLRDAVALSIFWIYGI